MSRRSVAPVIVDGRQCARITGNWSNSWMGEHPVAQVWIEIEENDNCGYHPLQTFEQQGEPTSYSSVVVEDVAGAEGPHEVVGWTTEDGGGPCDVTVILIGDSGSGQSILVHGGDAGVRMRPADSQQHWDLDAPDQVGEPYILVPANVSVRPPSS